MINNESMKCRKHEKSQGNFRVFVINNLFIKCKNFTFETLIEKANLKKVKENNKIVGAIILFYTL